MSVFRELKYQKLKALCGQQVSLCVKTEDNEEINLYCQLIVVNKNSITVHDDIFGKKNNGMAVLAMKAILSVRADPLKDRRYTMDIFDDIDNIIDEEDNGQS